MAIASDDLPSVEEAIYDQSFRTLDVSKPAFSKGSELVQGH
jgi:hypothetical protein